jgi:hypothetical protein
MHAMAKIDLPEFRVPLYRVAEWIVSEYGVRDLDMTMVRKPPPSVNDRPSYDFDEKLKDAGDAASAGLLKAIIAGELAVEGLRDGDASRAFEQIRPCEFGDAVASPFRISLELIVGNRRYLDLCGGDSTIRCGSRVFWGDLRVASRADVLAIWPEGADLEPLLIEAANRNGGALRQKKAMEIARETGVSHSRAEVRNAIKRLGLAGKQGRKKNTP